MSLKRSGSGAAPAASAGGAVAPTGDPDIDGLLYGSEWAGGTVAYSAPDRARDYEASYASSRLEGFGALGSAQLAAMHAALNAAAGGRPEALGFSVQGFTALDLDFIGGGSGAGDIRLANNGVERTATAYFPDDGFYGGDVWFGRSGAAPHAGNYDYHTMLHELGHALGLKHGHEASGFGAAPEATDVMEYSVMSYRSHAGATPSVYLNERWGYAQSYMMLDIAALQSLYGANYATNAGDTVYSWSPTSGDTLVDGVAAIEPGRNRVFVTVWDGGGVDVYDLSDHDADLQIDLAPGAHSRLDPGQRAHLGGGPDGGFARGEVFNALLHQGDTRSLIENAIGGSGDDAIRGNEGANRLEGRFGDDRLYGRAGDDLLLGGSGRDQMRGGSGNDALTGGSGRDGYYGGAGVDTAVLSDQDADGVIRLGDDLAVFGGVSERLRSIEAVVSGAGSDRLFGDDGANLLDGRGGADRIDGGGGADVLIGGSGRDVFVFRSVADSPRGAGDVIRSDSARAAFERPGPGRGDRIDLSRIDADATQDGHQAFAFGVERGLGRLWLVERGDDSVLRADVDPATKGWDFDLRIADGAARASAYETSDFLL